MSRGKAFLIGLLLAWGVAVFVAVRNHSEANKLRADNDGLRRQADDLEAETVRLSNSVGQATAGTGDRSADLLRLRAEVTALRKQTNELERLRSEVVRLRSDASAAHRAPTENTEPPPTEERRQAMARISDSRTYVLGFIMYAEENGGNLATNFDQIAPFIAESKTLTGTNRFEIVYSGALRAATNPSMTILLREAEARQQANGKWTKAYAFVDGHSEIHMEPENNFEEFEKQRIMVPAQ
jgi:hypothetical protein